MNVYPGKRLTAEEVLKHRWFENTPDFMDIMDEQEKDLIRREYFMRENEAKLNTQFTEFSICSDKSGDPVQDNLSEKSVVFCPFNSINKQDDINNGIELYMFQSLRLPSKTIKYSQ